MATTVFEPSPPPTVAVAGTTSRFPVHRIYCVGRNYADHIREMGGTDPRAEPPVFFAKPPDAVIGDGAVVPYPSRTANFHYEGELVIAIGRAGRAVAPADAAALVYGYAVGNDYTRRDLQAGARKAGLPWDVAKGFDHSAGIGAIHPLGPAALPRDARLWLRQNGELRQDARLADMIWDVPAIIAELSTFVELKAGDLIYTGTPAGVGALSVGDEIVVGIDGLGELRQRIGAPS